MRTLKAPGKYLPEALWVSFGGDEGDRTPDILIAIQVPSQLS